MIIRLSVRIVNTAVEPGMDRVVDGIPNRVDRIRCLGNAVVPQQFYPFFAAMVQVEKVGTLWHTEVWYKGIVETISTLPSRGRSMICVLFT